MAQVILTMKNYFGRAFDEISTQAETWPQERRDALCRQWQDLLSAGADMVEVRGVGAEIQCFPSDDFMRFCADNGIKPWW